LLGSGLGWLDETELETIPQRQIVSNDPNPLLEEVPANSQGQGEGVSHASAEKHPTADEVTKLIDTARAANVDLETFGHDMRRLIKLPESQKITKKFLCEQMTMSQYNTARAHYSEALRLILEEDVPDHKPPTTDRTVSTDETPASQGIAEGATDGPFASSSAAAADADAAREKLRGEAIAWGIPEAEITHILGHYDLSKARNILWKARRNQPAPVWVAAAD